jgi:RNA 3'-terminal phosphate cyclase (ATP)
MSPSIGTIHVDGSQGEGGGQILRTSLALAALEARPLVVSNIRAKRKRPGLLRQHLTAFRAVARICNAAIEGADLGSDRLTFRPGPVQPGHYHFDIGTAGSATLVLQTVLWPLLLRAGAPSTILLEGGTHNPLAPPFDFLADTFAPVLRAMGAAITLRLERHGFHPRGGGRLHVQIQPCTALAPLDLVDAGPVKRRIARAVVADLPASIAERELRALEELDLDERRVEAVSSGPGNVLLVQLERDRVTETIASFGARGVPAERVAARAAAEAKRYLEADVPVGEHLADQLVLPLALAGRGAFRTLPLSQHATTNIDVVAAFTGRRARVTPDGAAVIVELP